jgi:hypothetical protein
MPLVRRSQRAEYEFDAISIVPAVADLARTRQSGGRHEAHQLLDVAAGASRQQPFNNGRSREGVWCRHVLILGFSVTPRR